MEQKLDSKFVNKPSLKLAKKSAVILYGLGDLASQFVWTFVGSYLTIFYTDIVGMTPAAVSIIMLLARIWDGINDPMMGALAERTRSKFGRFRPWIAFGCPFLAVFGVLTFVNMGNGTGGVIFSAVIYILAGMLYTVVNIPYSSLAAVMTEDANQRNLIGTSRSIGMNLGMIIVNSCSAGLALFFSGEGALVANSRGYMMVAAIYGLISIPLFLAVFFSSKELVMPVHDMRKVTFKETIYNVVSNRYLMVVFFACLLQMTAFMGRIAITTYYVIYCLGAFTLIALIMTIPSIGGVIGSCFVAKFAKKFGKRNVLMATFVGQGIGLLIVYFASFENMNQILVGHWIYGIFNCGFPLTLAMVADSVDYQEKKSGIRTDGTAYATYGLSTKVGNAIGAAVGVLMLAGFGYVANHEQTMVVKQGINLTVNLIPAILLFVAAALLLLWNKKDSEFDEIRSELREIKDTRE